MGELGVPLHGEQAYGEHGHGVAVTRHAADDIPHVGRNVLANLPLGQNFVDLGLGGHVAGEKEIPERFHGRIFGAGSLGKSCEGLGNGLAAEADTFLRIEVGDVGNQAVDVASAADGLIDSHLVDDDLAVFFDQVLDVRTKLLNFLLQYFLQRHLLNSFPLI